MAGNLVTPFLDANAAFAAMLDAIQSASNEVLLCQYIFEADGIGQIFIDALQQAVDRGCAVRVILDRVGSWYSRRDTARQLREAGVSVTVFLPFRAKWAPPNFNLRNHRKLLLIDQRRAFVGGMNIRNSYLASTATGQSVTRDAHFEIVGPVVEPLVTTFRTDWLFAGESSFPVAANHQSVAGDCSCRVTVDGPDNDFDLITIMLLNAVAQAEQSIDIVTPYCLPPREVIAALQAAQLRGVAVSIVLPVKSNLRYLDWAMQHSTPELLQFGIRIYQQSGHFDHSKLILIDDTLAIIGSNNIDPRSLRLNFELAIEVRGSSLTEPLQRHLQQLKQRASVLAKTPATDLPIWRRLRNALAWLASPYL